MTRIKPRPSLLALAALTGSALTFSALAAPVLAQGINAPRIRPSHDVVVNYRIDGAALSLVPGGLPGVVTLSWSAGTDRLRAEGEGRSQVALIDLRGHTGRAIDTQLRVVLPLPIRPQDLQPLTLEDARLTPLPAQAGGREVIAGLACTGYSFDSPQGPGQVCLTADGVPLRGQGTVNGKPGRFVATAVAYRPLPAELFTVPSGYISLEGAGKDAGGLAGLARQLGAGGGLNDLRGLLGHSK